MRAAEKPAGTAAGKRAGCKTSRPACWVAAATAAHNLAAVRTAAAAAAAVAGCTVDSNRLPAAARKHRSAVAARADIAHQTDQRLDYSFRRGFAFYHRAFLRGLCRHHRHRGRRFRRNFAA